MVPALLRSSGGEERWKERYMALDSTLDSNAFGFRISDCCTCIYSCLAVDCEISKQHKTEMKKRISKGKQLKRLKEDNDEKAQVVCVCVYKLAYKQVCKQVCKACHTNYSCIHLSSVYSCLHRLCVLCVYTISDKHKRDQNPNPLGGCGGREGEVDDG